MTPLSLIGGGVAGLGAPILLRRSKLRRHNIRQNRFRIGSALLGGLVATGTWQARPIVIRGKAAFCQHRPFEHGGVTFQMIPAEQADARSAVLRRFIEATCRMLATGALA